MFATQLLLLLLQVCLSPTARAASPPSSPKGDSITIFTETVIANHDCASHSNLESEMCLFFDNPGEAIPAAELRHTLAVAAANVYAHLPHSADEPISKGFFETNVSFAETEDRVALLVHDFGTGLSWRQLNESLSILRVYMLGRGPGHPATHYEELEFHIHVTPGLEVARGVVVFTPGAKAVAKRNPATTIVQLSQANPVHSDPELPILYNIPKSNLDLNVTYLGVPIPEYVILHTIDRAFTDIMLEHDDVELTIPKNLYPYSFNYTSGKMPDLFTTSIRFSAMPGKKISWGLLCLLYTGLRNFMQDTEYFNVTKFEFLDARKGKIGFGDVLYWEENVGVATERLRLG